MTDLPLYRCHKEVRALKIKSIRTDTAKPDYQGAFITPEEPEYSEFHVDHDYVLKHNPQVGGYFVVYEDGYQSYSPATAFETGYTLVV